MCIQHILAPFHLDGDGAWLAVDIAETLHKSGHNVALWSTQQPTSSFKGTYDINTIRPYQGNFPQGGNLKVIGEENDIGSWYSSTKFQEISYFCYQYKPRKLHKILNRLTFDATQSIKIEYIDLLIASKVALPGKVFIFAQDDSKQEKANPIDRNNRKFTVARIGRDELDAHHHKDPSFYESLVLQDCEVIIKGGLCLIPWLGNTSGVSLEAELNKRHLSDFLNNVDCLYYSSSMQGNCSQLLHHTKKSRIHHVIHESNMPGNNLNNIHTFSSFQKALDIISGLKELDGRCFQLSSNNIN